MNETNQTKVITFNALGKYEKLRPTVTPFKASYDTMKEMQQLGKLIPGQLYRITDYVTTTTQADTQSAGHQFDIMVVALNETTLSEEAWAIQHDGDTYFKDSRLEAWQLKYRLDNEDVTESGKGTITWMKDEWGNEAAYDFKNIQQKRWKVTDELGRSSIDGKYLGVLNNLPEKLSIEDESDFIWAYLYSVYNYAGGTQDTTDHSLTGNVYEMVANFTVDSNNAFVWEDDSYEAYKSTFYGSVRNCSFFGNIQNSIISGQLNNLLINAGNGASGTINGLYTLGKIDGKTITVPTNAAYPTYAAMTTEGQMKTWNPADSLNPIESLGAYDISAAHASGGVLATYADLTAALGTNGANIPEGIRKGGMSVKFVLSSDNKYVQYSFMLSEFTAAQFTNIANWQGVDDVPTAGSGNLVKSGGVWNAIPRNKNNIPSKVFMCDGNGNVVLDLSNGFVKTKNFDSTTIPEEIERLLQIIAENYEKIEEVENKINLRVSDEFGSIRLFVKDENGNVLLELYDGIIKTKSFNSNVLPTINTNNNNEFNICDCFGNVLLSVKNGNIISKYFNSNDVNTLALRVSEIERKSDGYDSLIARSTPAISWIDDDFDTSSSERREKLNILKAWAIENNIKPDIALIPDVTYTDVQKTDIESVYFNNERLALAMEFEYSGLHMLTHPIHYGIYGDVIKDSHYIRKDLFLSRKALLDAGFPGCEIFVYAGSSAGVADVVEAAKAYYDVAIMPGGNTTNVNLPTKQNRFRLVRFSLDDISANNTVSQIKQQIDECIATGGWIIFITHVWMHTGDGTEPVDETSNSLSNVFNIIQYANQRVQIRPTQEVWKEKKILWEYYK